MYSDFCRDEASSGPRFVRECGAQADDMHSKLKLLRTHQSKMFAIERGMQRMMTDGQVTVPSVLPLSCLRVIVYY